MAGDIIVNQATGGSSYGDVLERAPDLVMKDIKDEIISHWTAENVYKVVYDHQTLEVDGAKTHEVRQKEKENRLKRGRSYQDFEKEWSQKKPKDDILKYYGSWPDAKKVREIIRI